MRPARKLLLSLLLVLGGGVVARAQGIPPAALKNMPSAPAAAAPAAQPPAEPFDLEKERQKAAGTFEEVVKGRRRRNPFENPLRAAARPTPVKGLPEEEQAKLVTEAELALGLYQAALRRQELTSANVHLNRLMEILAQVDEFTVPEFRQRLERVRSALGGAAVLADRKFIAVKQAFEAGNYEQVAALYDDLQKFVEALPKEEKAKLAGRLAEIKAIAQRAAARLAFSKIPLTITGVVISRPRSYATINGMVLGVGDLVRKPPSEGGPVSPLKMTEPLEPPVKVAEIRLTEVVFEFQGERLSRRVGRRYLLQEKARRSLSGAGGR